MPPFNHFTTKAKEAIRRAHEIAIERGQNHVNPLHLLSALILQEESMVLSILERLGVDTILLTDSILESIDGGSTTSTLSASYQVYLTPELAQTIETSAKVAATLKDEFISTEHLLIALFDVSSSARDILLKFRIDRSSVVRVLEELRTSKTPDAREPKKSKAIAKYTRSLTKMALENKLDPVIGRDLEINRIIQILSRRTKNNPILIGEAGVGKTAIVEGLALRMALGDVPESLKDKESWSCSKSQTMGYDEWPSIFFLDECVIDLSPLFSLFVHYSHVVVVVLTPEENCSFKHVGEILLRF